MSTLEIRKEILDFVKNEDESSLTTLYQLFKAYKEQKQLDKMIAEGEEDIKAGRVHSMDDIKQFIRNWTVS
jgi:predicted transcriptional regulator